ncbi:uncharacterized protein A1O5_10965 [Cladophialophora psammophila CBS 110553]|uniref:Amino acid transporter transmembrane domain-containing protein n=1 Tax=Cladophialophora psammophila CBS 110553 TaxID=1182543 RepID=W9WDI2_9EURO|nr:uncharacterized protein A1O5_10965 [Cladophialophora psammophila CBS 110553]EXJ65988.1 hypothetical protein A1O5_10965 [Cladophialophora psammophila CBS 110553]
MPLQPMAPVLAVLVLVAAIAGFLRGSIQTLGRISWLAWVGLTSIVTARNSSHSPLYIFSDLTSSSVLTVTIAVGVHSLPADAPQVGPWSSDYKLFKGSNFTDAISAVSSLVFAYAGTPGFFAIVSEVRAQKHYTRSLLICQSGVTATYITMGVVVYYYCGSCVASPALGSAGVVMKKACYGLALPGLLVSTTLFIHVSISAQNDYSALAQDFQLAAKYIFVRILRLSRHLSSNTMAHWVGWISCTFGVSVISYIIASAIPVFGGLVSLIGALLGTLMSFQPITFMWLFDNRSLPKTKCGRWWTFMVGWGIFAIVPGTFLMICSTYGSIVGIIDLYKASGGSAAFSCADNSNSVHL